MQLLITFQSCISDAKNGTIFLYMNGTSVVSNSTVVSPRIYHLRIFMVILFVDEGS